MLSSELERIDEMPSHLDKIKIDLETLQFMIELGRSFKSCDIQVRKVTRPVLLFLVDGFSEVWFEGVLEGIALHVIKTLELAAGHCSELSSLGFERYHQNLLIYLRESPKEKEFEKVLHLYRRIGELVLSNKNQTLVKNRIQEIESLLAKKKRQGQIIKTNQ